MQLKKAVIPAAGFGTRMLPAAKAVPKELLPVVDRPAIQYIIEEAAAAGVSDICLITARGKKALEEHFTLKSEVIDRLRATKKGHLLKSLVELLEKVSISSVIQDQQHGLGDAVAQARKHVGNEPFLCMLGDAIFNGEPSPSAQLMDAYRTYGTSVIGLEEVPLEKVSRYGIAGGSSVAEGIIRIDQLIEKPKTDEAPSRLAIAARYILTPAIFECLDRTAPGAGGEIQLTDAIRLLMDREAVHGVVLRARRHDIGNPLDWLRANLAFAARDPELWKQLTTTIDALRNP
jgi:UTP--glucose-1-phosphate uridylyltransferase